MTPFLAIPLATAFAAACLIGGIGWWVFVY